MVLHMVTVDAAIMVIVVTEDPGCVEARQKGPASLPHASLAHSRPSLGYRSPKWAIVERLLASVSAGQIVTAAMVGDKCLTCLQVRGCAMSGRRRQ
jgi:hypothetical protein